MKANLWIFTLVLSFTAISPAEAENGPSYGAIAAGAGAGCVAVGGLGTLVGRAVSDPTGKKPMAWKKAGLVYGLTSCIVQGVPAGLAVPYLLVKNPEIEFEEEELGQALERNPAAISSRTYNKARGRSPAIEMPLEDGASTFMQAHDVIVQE